MLKPIKTKTGRALSATVTPDEIELAKVFREMDRGRLPVEEDDESLEEIQKVIREYRTEKRRRKE